MNDALEVRDVEKRFGGVVVANGMHLTIPRRRITGIIGPNGAGKSTLFNMICGFVRPDQGSIHLGKTDLTRKPAFKRARLGISRTWQHVRLFSSLSVHDNLILGARLYRGESTMSALFRPAAIRRETVALAERADQLLDRIGLMEKRNDLVTALSYGQQKRIGLARALMNDGPFLLLDEPLAGVDGRNYEILLAVIRDEAAKGRGICVIEHNMSFMAEMVQDLVFLYNGKVEARGAPSAILADKRIRQIYFGNAA
jgi:ABC-type branched-subunit amino acid transport system ATPase component